MHFPVFPMRQVHLDFHTSPEIPDVGADWDADAFVQTLVEARVNSITVFAKCHHGMNYYPSAIGPVHPSLKLDLLGEQIEACHRAGIRCPIYVSVVWDESAAERHPEWRQVDQEGHFVGRGPFEVERRWSWLCVNNAYADELVAQTGELMARYDCDGFFFDILMYHPDGCVCANCLREMRSAGIDPTDAAHRLAHNKTVARRFMERMSQTIRARLPHAGIFYNSRWGLQFEGEAEYYSQVEIESLPTGGWGYGFYPLWSRWARSFGLPMLGMTGRFHRSWADWGGLKHPDALRWECAGILATGGAISIGDQMHPRGRLNGAVYDVIGEAFRDVEAVERYCIDARPESQIGMLVLQPDTDKATDGEGVAALEGAAKMLVELHHQFDVITHGCPNFDRYDVLVVPDASKASPEVVARLSAYVRGGGKLLLSHQALLDPLAGVFQLGDEIGVDYEGPCTSNPDYFTVDDPALQTTLTRSGFAYSLYDGPCSRVRPREGTTVLARAYETYFNRTWEHFSSHGYTPPLPWPAGYPAITRRGDVVYIYGPIFGAYHRHGNLTFRALAGRCLDLLLARPLVRSDAPATAEITTMRQDRRQIVHVVNYHAARRSPLHVEALESPAPLRDVMLEIRRPEATGRAFLAHSGEDLPFHVEGETVRVVIPRVDVSALVVFEGVA